MTNSIQVHLSETDGQLFARLDVPNYHAMVPVHRFSQHGAFTNDEELRAFVKRLILKELETMEIIPPKEEK